MALPLSRNTTYSGATQIKSADLNDLQDQIIRHERGAHVARRRFRHASEGRQVSGAGGSFDSNGRWQNGATSDLFMIPFEIEEGDRVTGFEFKADPAASGVVTAQLRRQRWDADTINTVAPTGSTSGDLFQTVAVTGLNEVATAVNGIFYLYFSFTLSTGHLLIGAALIVDRP